MSFDAASNDGNIFLCFFSHDHSQKPNKKKREKKLKHRNKNIKLYIIKKHQQKKKLFIK